eukprot:m.179427 g.179427  ORF g.179427 m.179427 type:complete len:93 (+) comp14762_c0_seq1:2359-2637(+)
MPSAASGGIGDGKRRRDSSSPTTTVHHGGGTAPACSGAPAPIPSVRPDTGALMAIVFIHSDTLGQQLRLQGWPPGNKAWSNTRYMRYPWGGR